MFLTENLLDGARTHALGERRARIDLGGRRRPVGGGKQVSGCGVCHIEVTGDLI